MPAKYFICSDNTQIEIAKCLEVQGCRLKERCAPVAYLRSIAFDREWRGITASMAGNGPRLIYLKRVKDYAIKPDGRAFAVLGIKSHIWLAREKVTNNILAEEKSKHGTPDCLEIDEYQPGFILYDYKTFGAFKVNMILGRSKNDKGEWTINPEKADTRDIEYQMNRYRQDFKSQGFNINKMYIFVIIRDGTAKTLKMNGLDSNTIKIPVKFLTDEIINNYYEQLEREVNTAMETKYARSCDEWESWQGKRCDGYCEVSEYCQQMHNNGLPF